MATAVLAARATPEAMERLRTATNENAEELSPIDRVRIVGPAYIKASFTAACSIACIFGANALNKKQQISLIAAYTTLNRIHKEYKKRMVELGGDEVELSVRKAIIEDKIGEVETHQQGEKLLFYEERYGKFFERTMEEVITAEYHFNRNFTLRGYANLNEFYDFLGLPHTKDGAVLGWSLGAGAELYGYTWVDFNHGTYTTEDGLLVHDITTPFEPTADYLDH